MNIHQRSLILGCLYQGFLHGSVGKESRRWGFDSWVGKIPWRRGVFYYSCCRISWTEEAGRLQSIELQRIGHDWSNWAHTTFIIPNLPEPTALSLNTSEGRQTPHSLASVYVFFFFFFLQSVGIPSLQINQWLDLFVQYYTGLWKRRVKKLA